MKLLVYTSILLSVICMIAINANLPVFADQSGINTDLLGWVVAMNPLLCLVFSVPFAYISDKYNRIIVIFIGLVFYFISALILVLFHNIEGLFAVKAFEGLALAAFIPASTAFITDISKKENLSQNLGHYTAVFNLGFLVAPLFSGLIGKYLGVEQVFIFVLICSSMNLLLSIPLYIISKKQKIKKKVL